MAPSKAKITHRRIFEVDPTGAHIELASNIPKAKPTAKKTKITEQSLFVGGQRVNKRFQGQSAITSEMVMLNGVQTMIVEKTEALTTVSVTNATYNSGTQNFYPSSTGIPWLGSISRSFTQYQVLELEFTYVPNVPTTQAGSFMMAWTGDFGDVVPVDQAAFLQTEQALLAPVYAGTEGGRALQHLGFPKGDVVGFSVPKYTYSLGTSKQPNTYKIVRNDTFTGFGSADKNLYSPGRLLYASNGITGATTLAPVVCGQLFVRYRLRLLGAVKPDDNV